MVAFARKPLGVVLNVVGREERGSGTSHTEEGVIRVAASKLVVERAFAHPAKGRGAITLAKENIIHGGRWAKVDLHLKANIDDKKFEPI